MQTGLIKGSSYRVNRDGSGKKLLLEVEITDPDDIQTVELMTQAGDDINPPDNSRVTIIKIGSAWKIAIASDDGIAPDETLNKGERKIYASDGTDIKSFINWLVNGNVQINGSGDFAVRYDALSTILDTLATDINTELGKIATAITGLGGSYTVSPISINASSAKIETIEVPS